MLTFTRPACNALAFSTRPEYHDQPLLCMNGGDTARSACNVSLIIKHMYSQILL